MKIVKNLDRTIIKGKPKVSDKEAECFLEPFLDG